MTKRNDACREEILREREQRRNKVEAYSMPRLGGLSYVGLLVFAIAIPVFLRNYFVSHDPAAALAAIGGLCLTLLTAFAARIEKRWDRLSIIKWKLGLENVSYQRRWAAVSYQPSLIYTDSERLYYIHRCSKFLSYVGGTLGLGMAVFSGLVALSHQQPPGGLPLWFAYFVMMGLWLCYLDDTRDVREEAIARHGRWP